MEPVFFVMAILGCNDMQTQCEQARIAPARYETAAQCQAAMADVLPRNTDLLFPTIAATCQRNGNLTAKAEGKARG
jgi:hypothetical protein